VPTVARSFKHGITTESSMSSPGLAVPDGASSASVIDFIVSMNPVNQETVSHPANGEKDSNRYDRASRLFCDFSCAASKFALQCVDALSSTGFSLCGLNGRLIDANTG